MPFLLVLLCANIFILLAPFLLIAAAIWGSGDEQWFMVRAFWVVSPLTVWMWYLILRMIRRWHELQAQG